MSPLNCDVTAVVDAADGELGIEIAVLLAVLPLIQMSLLLHFE